MSIQRSFLMRSTSCVAHSSGDSSERCSFFVFIGIGSTLSTGAVLPRAQRSAGRRLRWLKSYLGSGARAARPAIGQHARACLHDFISVSQEALAILSEKLHAPVRPFLTYGRSLGK